MKLLNTFLSFCCILFIVACCYSDNTKKEIESKYFIIEYRQFCKSRINGISSIADEAYTKILEFLDCDYFKERDKTILKICETKDEYIEESLKLGASWELSIYSCGITFNSLKCILIEKRNSKLDNRIIYHEILHGIINSLYNDNFPLWLNEGLAVYAESFSGRESDIAKLKTHVVNYQKELDISFFNFENMNDVYPKSSDDTLMFYYQSYSFVKYLISEFGIESFREFLYLIPLKKYSLNEKCLKCYEKEITQLQKDWENKMMN